MTVEQIQKVSWDKELYHDIQEFAAAFFVLAIIIYQFAMDLFNSSRNENVKCQEIPLSKIEEENLNTQENPPLDLYERVSILGEVIEILSDETRQGKVLEKLRLFPDIHAKILAQEFDNVESLIDLCSSKIAVLTDSDKEKVLHEAVKKGNKSLTDAVLFQETNAIQRAFDQKNSSSCISMIE